MGFFDKLKQAFGFGGNEYEEEEDTFGIDATVQPRQRRNDDEERDSVPGEENVAGQPDAAPEDPEPSIPLDSIFNTVVEEFNRAMPSFIGSGVNAEAQRSHLYEALDADVKKLLESLRNDATQRCNRRWEKERRALNGDVSAMRDRLRTAEENETEKGKQLLSAERQKRALTERVHDLEAQIANLEAEKDQYELETRSLVNKLRVSNMVNEGVEIPDVTTYEKRIGELTDENNVLTERATALEAENKDLSSQLSALKVKSDMADVMLNDLNTRAASSAKDVQARDEQIEALRQQLSEAAEQTDELRSELDEARANLDIAASVQEDVERIRQSIAKKNSQINELNIELRHREDRINALEAEEASLRRTIESNIHNQAAGERELRDEIERLKQQLAATGVKEKNRSKRKATKISAIDEDLDNTDWLVATPPEGTSARTSGVSDAEFGYQEPQRKNPPENSAQMSLW